MNFLAPMEQLCIRTPLIKLWIDKEYIFYKSSLEILESSFSNYNSGKGKRGFFWRFFFEVLPKTRPNFKFGHFGTTRSDYTTTIGVRLGDISDFSSWLTLLRIFHTSKNPFLPFLCYNSKRKTLKAGEVDLFKKNILLF